MSIVSALLGLDASHNAGKAFADQKRLNELSQQLIQQGIDYYKGLGGEAKGYRDQANVANTIYGNQAKTDLAGANYSLPDILAQLGVNTGVTGFGNPRGSASPEAYATPVYGGRVGSASGAELPGPYGPGGPTDANLGQYYTGKATAPSPYDISQPQQVQLNQQVDQLNSEKQSVIEDLRARYAQQGITDPRAIQAGIQSINERYDAMAAGHKANFAEQARANKEEALKTFVSLLVNQKNTAMGQIGDTVGQNLAIGSNALNQGAGAPFGSAANQIAGQAQQAGQMGQYLQHLGTQQTADFVNFLLKAATGVYGNPFAKKKIIGSFGLPTINGDYGGET